MSTTTTRTASAISAAGRPAKIRLEHVIQTFRVRPDAQHPHGSTLTAVQDVTLDIDDGEGGG
ncbi:hypothetical protein [Kocuria sp.]|uniref:hypothetical protein n=1 Tax=Kocuria sp. TaxID=1871328 RepID=UPI00281236CD|nr:hypothetical protein [Kocuria sp.]